MKKTIVTALVAMAALLMFFAGPTQAKDLSG